MKLKSFGCSFIFGSDLSDVVDNSDIASNLTWPALLAQQLGYTYTCYARPGAGNLQTLEKILDQAAGDDNDLFVIGWTWIDRFDYYNPEYNGKKWSDWQTIVPIDKTDLAKTYYRDLHSEYCDKFTSLSYIKLAIDTLKQKNISFIMTYIDELLFDQRWHTTPAVLDLQAYVRPYTTQFDGKTFLDYSKEKRFPISETFHPLEVAHLAASDYIIKVFDTQKTNALTQ
jgi:hypothetical protein